MNSSHPLVITLLGPTASGKTALALDIAERLDLPVINVDSRQLYREMDLGTAKPRSDSPAHLYLRVGKSSLRLHARRFDGLWDMCACMYVQVYTHIHAGLRGVSL